jgi:hypothetical protein
VAPTNAAVTTKAVDLHILPDLAATTPHPPKRAG